jgi:hypothetical protein
MAAKPTHTDKLAKERATRWKENTRKELLAVGVNSTLQVGVIVDTLYRLRRALQKTITRDKIVAVQQQLQDPKTHLLHVAGSDKWDPRELKTMITKDLPAAVQTVRTVGLTEAFFNKRSARYPKDIGDTNPKPNHERNLVNRRATHINGERFRGRLREEQAQRIEVEEAKLEAAATKKLNIANKKVREANEKEQKKLERERKKEKREQQARDNKALKLQKQEKKAAEALEKKAQKESQKESQKKRKALKGAEGSSGSKKRRRTKPQVSAQEPDSESEEEEQSQGEGSWHWVQCNKGMCDKWRRLEEPWTGRRKFYCGASDTVKDCFEQCDCHLDESCVGPCPCLNLN